MTVNGSVSRWRGEFIFPHSPDHKQLTDPLTISYVYSSDIDMSRILFSIIIILSLISSLKMRRRHGSPQPINPCSSTTMYIVHHTRVQLCRYREYRVES